MREIIIGLIYTVFHCNVFNVCILVVLSSDEEVVTPSHSSVLWPQTSESESQRNHAQEDNVVEETDFQVGKNNFLHMTS